MWESLHTFHKHFTIQSSSVKISNNYKFNRRDVLFVRITILPVNRLISNDKNTVCLYNERFFFFFASSWHKKIFFHQPLQLPFYCQVVKSIDRNLLCTSMKNWKIFTDFWIQVKNTTYSWWWYWKRRIWSSWCRKKNKKTITFHCSVDWSQVMWIKTVDDEPYSYGIPFAAERVLNAFVLNEDIKYDCT